MFVKYNLRSGNKPIQTDISCFCHQALIEGLGISLQKMTAPPAPNMPGPPQGMEPLGPMPPAGGTAPPPLPNFDVGSSSSPAVGSESSSSSSSGGLWSWFTGGEDKPQVRGLTAGVYLTWVWPSHGVVRLSKYSVTNSCPPNGSESLSVINALLHEDLGFTVQCEH